MIGRMRRCHDKRLIRPASGPVNREANLADAVALAASVHREQCDKAGQPYILHPLRVMLTLHDERAQIVAVLHDVLRTRR